MKLKAIIHEAEEGGFWAEVPALPGCVTQGESLVELEANLHEAIEGWLLAADEPHLPGSHKARPCQDRRLGGLWGFRRIPGFSKRMRRSRKREPRACLKAFLLVWKTSRISSGLLLSS